MTHTAIARLRAVIDHTELHALDDTVHTVDVYSYPGTTSVWVDTGAFIAWARSIAAETISIRDKRQLCHGCLDGGQPVRVNSLRTVPLVETVTMAVDEHPEWGEPA